jgi:predicted phosphodiesterase
MSLGHDLTGTRVSDDAAIHDVIKIRAKLEKTQRELQAVTRDRNDLLREYSDLQAAKYASPPPVAPKKKRTKDDFVRVVCSDLHGSQMDRPAVEAFLADLRTWDADEIILNGDMVECGGFLAAYHTLGYVAQTAYNYQDDIAAANWFLDEIAKAAPRARILFIEGNHDQRIEKWAVDQTIRNGRDAGFLSDLLAPRTLLRLTERGIDYFERSKSHEPGLPPGWIKRGKCFFVHELSGGKNAARSSLMRTAGNVVYAHTHQEDSSTVVYPGIGMVKAWNPGCLCIQQPLWRHTEPTSWSHGYAVQIVANSGDFLHLNIPICDGRSMIGGLSGRMKS